MLRSGAIVVALELVAIVVAFGYFGWPVLVMGVPVLLGTLLVFVFVRAYEWPRRRLQAHRASRWDPNATVPGGLMSGFFDLSKKRAQH
ncbi:MAG: hypothetical protein ACRDQ0_06450 [Pseudonocardia sp.]